MPNEFQTECYFIAADLAELCQNNSDIIVTIKISCPPDKLPHFEIVADGWRDKATGGTPVQGCPTPCHR